MKKILIVDDNEMLRRMIHMTLSQLDVELLEAPTGDEALEIIRNDRPDLVLLDVMMPGKIDGYELCEVVKSDPALEKVLVFFLTARGQSTDLARGRQVKSDGYILKPFSPLMLCEEIENAFAA